MAFKMAILGGKKKSLYIFLGEKMKYVFSSVCLNMDLWSHLCKTITCTHYHDT